MHHPNQSRTELPKTAIRALHPMQNIGSYWPHRPARDTSRDQFCENIPNFYGIHHGVDPWPMIVFHTVFLAPPALPHCKHRSSSSTKLKCFSQSCFTQSTPQLRGPPQCQSLSESVKKCGEHQGFLEGSYRDSHGDHPKGYPIYMFSRFFMQSRVMIVPILIHPYHACRIKKMIWNDEVNIII